MDSLYRIASRHCRAGGLLAVSIIAIVIGITGSQAREKDRTLKLFFTHTGERGIFTYKRHGRYEPDVIKKLNYILRDWRRNEPTNMDPQLFDLVWEVYREVGASDYIHIVSGYRSMQTNDMLRRRGRGAAKKSRHTRGQAMDFFIPGVSVAQIQRAGLQLQKGGVGYYPKSGSPFVHLDTGNVRHWPRMTRQQLVAVFPKGQTLHVPSDGKPLPGYEVAKANFAKGRTTVAYLDPKSRSIRTDGESGKQATLGKWLKRTLGGGADEQEDDAIASPEPILVAATQAPAPLPVPLDAAPLPRELSAPLRQTALAALEPPAPTIVAVAAVDEPGPAARPVVVAYAGGNAAEAASLSDRFAPALPASRTQDQIRLSRLMAQVALRADTEETVAVAEAPEAKPAPATFTTASAPDRAAEEPHPVKTAALVAGPADESGNTAIDAAAAISADNTITLQTENTLALAYAGFGPDESFQPRERPDTNMLIDRTAKPVSTPRDMKEISVKEIDDIIDRDLPVRPVAERKVVEFARFLGDKTTRTSAFAALEMPHPWGVPGLFSAPETSLAASQVQSSRTLRFDRFAELYGSIDPMKSIRKSRLASISEYTRY